VTFVIEQESKALRASCPDAAWWTDLLEGRLSPKEQAGLNSHLESCADCQQTLEGLTAGDECWANSARSLAPRSPEPALRRVIDDLKGAGGETTVPGVSAPPGRPELTFLRPPSQQGHLGRLGTYDVLEIIGWGGMGVVLKARDPALQRLVAIKVLAPQLATSASARQRFEREGRATALVKHEHVVAIFAVELADGLPYLVMEYVPGVSLQQQLDCLGPPEFVDILRIGAETASGLAAAHDQGLIHRDVKPANILLQDGGRVKLSDFGLARAVDDASLTQSGVIAGTPQYMAPEQARGEEMDYRADLFSLGSVLYALCTARPPFPAPTTLAVIRRVCDDTPLPIRSINPAIPEWVVDVIDKLHAKEPGERFQSAHEVAQLLSQYLRHVRQPEAVPAPPPLPRRPRGRPRPPSRRRLLWLLLLLVPLLGLGAWGGWFAFGSKTGFFAPARFDEQSVKLANGRIGRQMERTTFQVDYRFAGWPVPPVEHFVLVIQSPAGLILAKPYTPAELERSGTLKVSQFIPAIMLWQGDLTVYLAIEKTGSADGQRLRISNILTIR
jgi:serine/threonine protein kinase